MIDNPITDIPLPESDLPEIDSSDVPAIGAEDIADAPNDLSRPQKRLLKRLYNARTVPVIADDRPFLTYRDALRYLLSLPAQAQDTVYAQMKAHVRDKVR